VAPIVSTSCAAAVSWDSKRKVKLIARTAIKLFD
jgi:hypothetical protein